MEEQKRVISPTLEKIIHPRHWPVLVDALLFFSVLFGTPMGIAWLLTDSVAWTISIGLGFLLILLAIID